MKNTVEIQRHTTSLSRFIADCRRALRNTSNEMLINGWLDCLNEMPQILKNAEANPANEMYNYNNRRYDDNNGNLLEICKSTPSEYQVYLKDNYNFIFDYDGEFGYFFLTETENEI